MHLGIPLVAWRVVGVKASSSTKYVLAGYLVFGLPWVLPEVQRISTTSQRLSDISSIVLVGRPVFRLPWALPEAQHLLVRLWQGEPTKEDLQQHVVCSV
eukprot:scaffold110095_cov20-Tisochrysis_lutea.AAC.1